MAAGKVGWVRFKVRCWQGEGGEVKPEKGLFKYGVGYLEGLLRVCGCFWHQFNTGWVALRKICKGCGIKGYPGTHVPRFESSIHQQAELHAVHPLTQCLVQCPLVLFHISTVLPSSLLFYQLTYV